MPADETIVAIATPPGRGGIGVVRLSGPEAKRIAEPLLRFPGERALQPGRAQFGELIDAATGERIDEVVATYFAKPHSYTTEDVVEISCHGSPVVLQHVVRAAIASGARLAEPGEFTMRAFLNGRLDLTQAEAVRDLVDSQTLFQARIAAQQLGGALSHQVQPIKQQLVQLIARLEAGVDFAEDDVSVMPPDDILEHIAAIRAPLRKLADSFAFGKVVHEGLTLAIVGKPNVGKSSLFNCLVEHERAIVTPIPGTTRDLVSETVSIGGLPVRLVDTAGIRDANDEVENIGIRKSKQAIADADLVLVVLDASESFDEIDRALLAEVSERPSVVVRNKCDLEPAQLSPEMNANAALEPSEGSGQFIAAQAYRPVVRTSALKGEGIDLLRQTILDTVRGDAPIAEGGMLTNLRQQQQVNAAIEALDKARTAVEANIPHEMLLLDLYQSLRALDELTGATTADDILNLIFSTFCIGK